MGSSQGSSFVEAAIVGLTSGIRDWTRGSSGPTAMAQETSAARISPALRSQEGVSAKFSVPFTANYRVSIGGSTDNFSFLSGKKSGQILRSGARTWSPDHNQPNWAAIRAEFSGAASSAGEVPEGKIRALQKLINTGAFSDTSAREVA